MAAAVCKHAGARTVVVTDISPYRLRMAAELGADAVLDANCEGVDSCFERLGIAEGFGVGLEMSGCASAFSKMIGAMHNGGKIALLGLVPSDSGIDWADVIFRGLTIKGIYGRKMFGTWYKMTAMIQSGLDITSVITHTFHFSDYEKGFGMIKSGKAGKVILDWE